MKHSRVAAMMCAALALVVVLTSQAGHAGSVLWIHKSTQPIKWHQTTDLGSLLMATDDALVCFNPENGQIAWKRDDLKKITEGQVEEIIGTPLLLVGENVGGGMSQAKTKLHALDHLTGKSIWETEQLKGATVGILPVYEKNFVILLTVANPLATKDKPDLIALDMVNGKVLWEAVFDDKVDLHEADTSGRFVRRFDLSGHQPPIYDGNSAYFTYAGLHRYDLNTGKLIWKVPYDVTEGHIKRGNAQAIIDGDTIFTSAKGQLRAIDNATGQVKWTSQDFGGAVAEMVVKGDVLYGRLGGHFYDRSKKEWELKKPLGVVAVDKKTGSIKWRYDDAKDSVTNMVILEDQGVILIADGKNLIGLDLNSKGQIKESFKVRLEFKHKIGAGAVAGKALKVGLGGLRGLTSKSKGEEDLPVAISMRQNGIAVVRGKQHILAFDPKAKQIAWSVHYEAPGVSGWAKLAMASLSAALYTVATAQAANSYAGTSENQWANENRAQIIRAYSQYVSKRYTATGATDQYVYILTNVDESGEKGAGIIGVNMDTGNADRQIVFKDKDPNYKVDEKTGRVFNLKDEKELVAFAVK